MLSGIIRPLHIMIGSDKNHGNDDSSGAVYYFTIIDNNWVQTDKLIANDGERGDGFGHSVSLSGDRVLIGAYGDDDNNPDSGSAYVFDYDGSSWIQSQKLSANDGDWADNFGYSVSLYANQALIGARWDGDNGFKSGAAYIYRYDGSNWSQAKKLIASDGQARNNFGNSVSLSHNRALIGSVYGSGNNSSSGSAYIYDFIDNDWVESKKLIANDGKTGNEFGHAVSISSGKVLIGAYYNDVHGSAYVFDYIDNQWEQSEKLNSSEGSAGDWFGSSVSLFGNRVLIGAEGDDSLGSAYIFEYDGQNWILMQKLNANDGIPGDGFGFSVSLNEDRAIIGLGPNSDGAAYIFEYIGNQWIQTQKLIGSDVSFGDRFGYSVSLYGDRALIGAFGDSGLVYRSGTAFIFEFNGSTWSQTDILTADDASQEDLFGYSVSLFSDRALIGSYKDDDDGSSSGSAYVFDYVDGSWSQSQKLTASDATRNNNFGNSVSLNGDRILIGAFNDIRPGISGSAYIFDYDGNNWSETQKLTAMEDGGILSLDFGYTVSLNEGRAVIGAFTYTDEDYTYLGLAYVFDRVGNDWLQTRTLSTEYESLFAIPGVHGGGGISLSQDRLVIGVPLSNEYGTGSGSAYVYYVGDDLIFTNSFEEIDDLIFQNGFEEIVPK